jgi:hypothetical protein
MQMPLVCPGCSLKQQRTVDKMITTETHQPIPRSGDRMKTADLWDLWHDGFCKKKLPFPARPLTNQAAHLCCPDHVYLPLSP